MFGLCGGLFKGSQGVLMGTNQGHPPCGRQTARVYCMLTVVMGRDMFPVVTPAVHSYEECVLYVTIRNNASRKYSQDFFSHFVILQPYSKMDSITYFPENSTKNTQCLVLPLPSNSKP